jgi:osmoprotectant transport system substrate-binding protein
MFFRKILGGTALALMLLAAAPAAEAQVVVSSKIDTEGRLLGYMILDVLQAHGLQTVDRIALGTTPVVRKALISGAIDIYPEYTGNAAFFFNKPGDPAWKNADAGYQLAKQLDYDANKIVWLTPAPASNTWAIAISQDVADANHLVTLGDFGKWVTAGGTVKLVASAEFVNSPDALPAFESAYGFTLKPDQLIILSGGDTAATIAAAADSTDGANTAMVYSTDGGIGPSGLVVLDDNLHIQPVYEPAPLIREAVLKQHPEIATLLAPVFEKLDLATLQKLNGEIQVGGEPAQTVAEGFLKQNGFLK